MPPMFRYKLQTLLIVMQVAAVMAAIIGAGLRAYYRAVDITNGSVQERESRQAAERHEVVTKALPDEN